MLSTVLREKFSDNGYDFCAHETGPELQDRLVRSVWCRGHETSGFQSSSECLCAESAQASLYRYPLRFSFRGRRQWAQPSKSADSVGPAGGLVGGSRGEKVNLEGLNASLTTRSPQRRPGGVPKR